jgi:hypothetical protein
MSAEIVRQIAANRRQPRVALRAVAGPNARRIGGAAETTCSRPQKPPPHNDMPV